MVAVTFEYLGGFISTTWVFLKPGKYHQRCISMDRGMLKGMLVLLPLRNSIYIWAPPRWFLCIFSAKIVCHWGLGDHGLSTEKSTGTTEDKWGRRQCLFREHFSMKPRWSLTWDASASDSECSDDRYIPSSLSAFLSLLVLYRPY